MKKYMLDKLHLSLFSSVAQSLARSGLEFDPRQLVSGTQSTNFQSSRKTHHSVRKVSELFFLRIPGGIALA